MSGLFINHLSTPDGRFFYFGWILIAIVSTVLHELGHGISAIKLGDPTPRIQGRITGNPLVHMGPISLAALFLTGMCWGLMPIDKSRLKGRYGATKVALAGPLVNLSLGIIALIAGSLWIRLAGFPEVGTTAYNGYQLLWMTAYIELLLCMFNLLPIPPLDGSHIAADLSPGYRAMVDSEGFRAMGFFLFLAAFLLVSFLFEPMQNITLVLTEALSGTDLILEDAG